MGLIATGAVFADSPAEAPKSWACSPRIQLPCVVGSVPATLLPNASERSGLLDTQPGTAVVAVSPNGPGRGGAVPPKNESDWVARWLAGLGMFVSLSSLGFTLWKAHSDRKFSIEDDFWFRKVITPFSIEPLLKEFKKLVDSIPFHTQSEEDARKFALLVTQSFQEMAGLVEMLDLFDSSLAVKVRLELANCEDHLTEYAGGLAKGAADFIAVKQMAWQNFRNALGLIKASQVMKGRVFGWGRQR